VRFGSYKLCRELRTLPIFGWLKIINYQQARMYLIRRPQEIRESTTRGSVRKSLWKCYTCFWYETKTGVVHILIILSTQTFVPPYQWKSLAETFGNRWLRPILKNNQNRYHPRVGFTPKIPKTRYCFYCEQS